MFVWGRNAKKRGMALEVVDSFVADRPQAHLSGKALLRQTMAGPTEKGGQDKSLLPLREKTLGLGDVSETMLWSLYNRACETRRRDGILVDPDSVRISDAMDYDFHKHFGRPAGSLAVRAAAIDRALRLWLEVHPDGFVVSLGEGLETQIQRVDNGRMRWLSVDLPAAIGVRERFITPTERFRHIASCALDFGWMDAVDPSCGVFVVAQGLLMYLEPAAVARLFRNVADRFPAADMVFDTIPRWFSRMTLLGHNQTPHYRLPPMPWGIDRNEIGPTLLSWLPEVGRVSFLDYRVPRGLPSMIARMIDQVPVLRHEVPSLVHISMSEESTV